MPEAVKPGKGLADRTGCRNPAGRRRSADYYAARAFPIQAQTCDPEEDAVSGNG
jgi:hypothetical protein